ncbi:hypothetical protein BKA70DRAFT_1508960 [Coprinopsis sp. MPI-PUGE-AT-0042]|nr:hypothetical protein BKA70DRAFT_1508960 [Coprinopsis sp. MPI-PUGE-AT-0042]
MFTRGSTANLSTSAMVGDKDAIWEDEEVVVRLEDKDAWEGREGRRVESVKCADAVDKKGNLEVMCRKWGNINGGAGNITMPLLLVPTHQLSTRNTMARPESIIGHRRHCPRHKAQELLFWRRRGDDEAAAGYGESALALVLASLLAFAFPFAFLLVAREGSPPAEASSEPPLDGTE